MRPQNRLATLFLLCLTSAASALHITPANPVVTTGDSLTLTAGDYSGDLLWNATRGEIQGNGAQVLYLPPADSGADAVTVLDSSGQVAAIGISVNAAQGENPLVKPQNALWRLFLRRDEVKAIAYSADGKTLWSATGGGLEQRDARSGELLAVFSDADGMPGNNVQALLPEADGGLWAGTWDGGLGYRNPLGQWTVFNTDNSPLTSNRVTALAAGADGSVWLGTFGADGAAYDWDKPGGQIFHLDAARRWTRFDPDNSPLEQNSAVISLHTDHTGELWAATSYTGVLHRDSQGNWQMHDRYTGLPETWHFYALTFASEGTLWVASAAGLARREDDDTWTIFDDSVLPDVAVRSLVADRNGGLWAGTREGGLVYRAADGAWTVFDRDNSPLPGNYIRSVQTDGQGGVWVGVRYGGLYHYDGAQWQNFATDNAGVAGHHIRAVLHAGDDHLWVGTWLRGLAHRTPAGAWEQFTPDNSPLPDAHVGHVVSDGQGGVWLGPAPETDFEDGPGGLSHYAAGRWSVFTKADSGLPADYFNDLRADGSGGVWMATNFGLAHLDAGGGVQVYHMDNSPLPGNFVRAVQPDSSGGVWAGTYRGLWYRDGQGTWHNQDLSSVGGDTETAIRRLAADSHGGLWVATDDALLLHRNADGNWRRFDADNAPLPDERLTALLPQADGSLWLGAGSTGLRYFDGDDFWQAFDRANSRLPDNQVPSLAHDGHGGIWVGTENGGLASLRFSHKEQVAAAMSDDSARDSLRRARRAAILIQPDGRSSGYNQARAVDFMAAYAYQTLLARGYDNDEIYFLSQNPDPDINADGLSDLCAVDAPVSLEAFQSGTPPRDLTQADIAAAFAWAQAQGTLDQPLLVMFIDHGLPEALMLDPLARERLSAASLKTLLDDYQTVTGNPVVVILEACHTGTFVPVLSAAERLVVTSTGDDLAYYADAGRTSFLKLYLDRLRQGDSFHSAWQQTAAALAALGWPFSLQSPALADHNALGTRCLNGCWGSLPGVLTLTVDTPPATVAPGDSVDLAVTTHVANTDVRSVWASVLTPRIAAQRNEQGYSRLPAPVVNLRLGDNGRWQGRFGEFAESGDYVFSLKARDRDGFVTEAAPLTLTVSGGEALRVPRFEGGVLEIPALTVPLSSETLAVYQVRLTLAGTAPLRFAVDWPSLQATTSEDVSYANFSFDSGILHLPQVELPGAGRYGVKLTVTPEWAFEVDLASLVKN